MNFKQFVSLVLFSTSLLAKSQSISHITVAGAMSKTTTSSGITNARMSWYSNNGGSGTSKEIYLNLDNPGNGDSLIVIGNSTDFKARIFSKSSNFIQIINQSVSNVNNTGGTTIQRGFAISSTDTAVSLEIKSDITSSTSGEIYLLYKPIGSSVNTSKYVQLFPESNAKSKVYRWIGTNNGNFHTPANWSPSRTTPSTSDVLIFDHVGLKAIEVLYNGGQFTQTVEQIMTTLNTKVVLVNYRGSNGALAKSTLKVNSGNNLDRLVYYTDQTLGEDKNFAYNNGVGDFDISDAAEFMIGGTDTIQIEFNSGACIATSPNIDIKTINDFGNGACLKFYINSRMYHNNQQYYNWMSFKTEANTSICFASNGNRYEIHHSEDWGWGTHGILGGEGRIVIEAGTSVHFQTGDGGTITLGGILELYGSLFASIKSNAPASSSASDWKNWVPFLQIKNDATRRGYIDTFGSVYWDANRIEGGVQWELYNSGTRSWRTVGFPLKNEMNVSQIANNIVITGTKNSTNQDSFYSFNSTCTTCKSSLLSWNETNSEWSAYESGSSAGTISTGTGVLLFFRGMGSNGVGDPSTSANSGTMIFKGEINYGDFTLNNLDYNSSGGSLKGVNLIANPYPAAVDWRTVISNGNNSNIADKFYYFNPKAQNYSVYNNTTGSLTLSGSTAYTNSSNDEAATIEQGAGFFVVATNSSNSLNFTENCKTPKKGKTSAFKEEKTIPCNQLSMNLNYNTISSNREDNSVLEWDMSKYGSTNTEDLTDATKLFAGYLGIGTADKNNIWYAIDRRADLIENELNSIPLVVKTMEKTDYKISFTTCADLGNTEVQILDKLTNKTIQVSNGVSYIFSTSSTDALNSDQRFELLITKKSELSSVINKNNKYFYVYPNPTVDKTIRFTELSANNELMNVTLLSIDGKIIAQFNQINNQSVKLPNSIKNGIYILEITSKMGKQIERLIIE